MKLLSIDYIPGAEIEVLGVVKGTVVQSKNIGRDFMAGMKTLVGGEIVGYTEMLIEARQIATKRMVDEAEELGADAVICGPCFNYADYAHMSAILSEAIEAHTDAKSIVVCSEENESTIQKFKDKVTIVKMPKKGGTGLNESLKNMMNIAKLKVENKPKETYELLIY